MSQRPPSIRIVNQEESKKAQSAAAEAKETEKRVKVEPVPDPFVFPVRVRKPDWTIAWQKKRSQFKEQQMMNSLVHQQILENGADRIQHERTHMDHKQFKEIQAEEEEHNNRYTK